MPTEPAALFLLVSVAVFLPLFALPLLFAPFAWARVFRWTLPADRDLARYFGRCLGAVACALAVLVLRAAFDATLRPATLELLIVAFGILVGVHVWGAIRKQQPWTETAEIALYLAFSGAAAWFRWGSF
jgi:hypothetical protein